MNSKNQSLFSIALGTSIFLSVAPFPFGLLRVLILAIFSFTLRFKKIFEIIFITSFFVSLQVINYGFPLMLVIMLGDIEAMLICTYIEKYVFFRFIGTYKKIKKRLGWICN